MASGLPSATLEKMSKKEPGGTVQQRKIAVTSCVLAATWQCDKQVQDESLQSKEATRVAETLCRDVICVICLPGILQRREFVTKKGRHGKHEATDMLMSFVPWCVGDVFDHDFSVVCRKLADEPVPGSELAGRAR